MKLKEIKDNAKKVKDNTKRYRELCKLLYADSRTPKVSKLLLWITIGYALSPIDLSEKSCCSECYACACEM